ncbi:MAG TPA: TIM barrel protein [Flavitalea sp.]|nr:TIM barrel protein [Flavitalea sp.]
MTKRRDFIRSMAFGAFVLGKEDLLFSKASRMRVGLVTYQWGKDWDVPTIIRNCEKSRVLGVELRTQHKHGVEPSLNAAQRQEVKKRFADSKVTLLGYGSNAEFDSPDPAVLKKNIDEAKALLQLSHDIGGSGVKVKPNKFHKDVPREQTLEQIGNALNELGRFADGLNQQVRLEVHGPGTQELPNIKAIMDVADHPRVAVCWNCNPTDLEGNGFEYNFNLVNNRLGDTIHIHEMNAGGYPCEQLVKLLARQQYSGWLLLECVSEHDDNVKAMKEQRILWEKLIARY